MEFRTLLAVGLVALVSAAGCAGISGQRYYAEPKGAGRGLGDIVDCPTCPSSRNEREAVAHAAHDDGVLPPHAKFHPVPTRPVFAPKVALASATLSIAPQPATALPTPATQDEDAAPAPPPAELAETRTATRSVLKQTPPTLLPPAEPKPLVVPHQPIQLPAESSPAEPMPAEAPPARTASDGWRPRVAN